MTALPEAGTSDDHNYTGFEQACLEMFRCLAGCLRVGGMVRSFDYDLAIS